MKDSQVNRRKTVMKLVKTGIAGLDEFLTGRSAPKNSASYGFTRRRKRDFRKTNRVPTGKTVRSHLH